MTTAKKKTSVSKSDPRSSAFIRGTSFSLFHPGTFKKIGKERLVEDPSSPLGIPRTDNGNSIWIQHFHSALNKKGRAGFVMANSAADARASFSRPEHCKLSASK